jgi:hypothetical protein
MKVLAKVAAHRSPAENPLRTRWRQAPSNNRARSNLMAISRRLISAPIETVPIRSRFSGPAWGAAYWRVLVLRERSVGMLVVLRPDCALVSYAPGEHVAMEVDEAEVARPYRLAHSNYHPGRPRPARTPSSAHAPVRAFSTASSFVLQRQVVNCDVVTRQSIEAGTCLGLEQSCGIA